MSKKNLLLGIVSSCLALAAPSVLTASAHGAPPANGQQAQDVCIDSLLRTIRAMPEGTYLDTTIPGLPHSGLSPGGGLALGTGSAFLLPHEYSVDYWLLGYPEGPQDAAYADVAAAWDGLGWPITDYPPDEVGSVRRAAELPDGYRLGAQLSIDGRHISLVCSSSRYPGWGPQPSPSPTHLDR
ncbi:hypothetical protein DFR76_108192 [Nocardia pseudobrasiliensis]|uniref:Secreted protein n=2 Tax=Nocardia pseudobrasiliensis TaxID=45979 RepID=A0A370I1A6_9NOCA|nr:hypothetical protein DFR76_108192 [Nocardia pseudobrasiliensis]